MLNQNRDRRSWKFVIILTIMIVLVSYTYVVERNRYHEKLSDVNNELDNLREKLINTEALHQEALFELLTKQEQFRWFQENIFRSEYIFWGMDTIKLMWCHDRRITADADQFLRQIIDHALKQPENVQKYLTAHPDWPAIFDVPFAGEFTGHTAFVRSIAFSPDDQILATGSYDRTARLWDIRSGQALYLLYGHQDWVTDVVFNPQGDKLITTSRDFTSRIWETKTGKLLHILEGQQGRPLAAAVSPNGQFVATAGDDGSVYIWSIVDGQLITQFKGKDEDFHSIAFSADNKRIAVGTTYGRVYIWDDDLGSHPSKKSNYYNKAVYWGWSGSPYPHIVNAVHFLSDEERIVSLHGWAMIHVWNADSTQRLKVIDDIRPYIHSIQISPDNQTLVSADDDSKIRLWDLQTGQIAHEIQAHTESVWDAAFSHDGRFIASGGDDHKARVLVASLDDLITAGRLIHSYEYKVKNDMVLISSPDILPDWCEENSEF